MDSRPQRSPRFLHAIPLSFGQILFVIAFCCIVAGFLAEMRMKRKYKALRVCGLVLVLLCVVKLVLVDIRYDNVLLRAAGFFVGGILCFGISLVYNLVDKRMGRRENAKN